MKLQASKAPDLESLQSKTAFARKTESPIKALRLLHGRLIFLSCQSDVVAVGARTGVRALVINDYWPPSMDGMRALIREIV